MLKAWSQSYGKFRSNFPSENHSYTRLYVFRAYRTPLRWIAAPLFLLLSGVDFLHMPAEAPRMLLMRIAIVAYVWFSFVFMAKHSFIRKKIYTVLLLLIVLVSAFCNYTVYKSGGVGSPYLPGLLVASSAFILMFRLGHTASVISQLIVCVPGVMILFATAPPDKTMDAVVTSMFFLSMIVIAWSAKVSIDEINQLFRRAQRFVRAEVERHRRSDMLKSHFPPSIREKIEEGKIPFEKQSIVPEAVVCFADLIGSTKIGNSVNLQTDWKLKESFLTAATTRARESGMIVLNQFGDGFLFIANYGGSPDWEARLLRFCDRLTVDLQDILQWLKPEIGSIESGVRFGIAQGPIVLGWIGNEDQSYYTAMGPDVNLASRLCSAAQPNEMVLSSRVRFAMEPVLTDRDVEHATYTDLKGFSNPVPATHVRPRKSMLLGSKDPATDEFIEAMLALRDKKSVA